jgi:proline dehydrogenase
LLGPLWLYAQAFTKRASRSYVAGAELANAVQVCHRLAQQGTASTVGYWNADNDAFRFVADAYLNALTVLAGEKLNTYLSIKAPALGRARELVTEVAAQAQQVNLGLHFDSLEPEVADETFSLIAEAARECAQVGCTLPGRWQRSLRDADAVGQLCSRVRVVKGQWADPLQPDLDLRTGFLNVIDRLAGRARCVAVATHDPALACEALWRLRAAGTPCELELLYGLPQKAVLRAVKDLRVPVRIYVPYGEAWLPYRLSQVRKNPRILWWVLRDALLAN